MRCRACERANCECNIFFRFEPRNDEQFRFEPSEPLRERGITQHLSESLNINKNRKYGNWGVQAIAFFYSLFNPLRNDAYARSAVEYKTRDDTAYTVQERKCGKCRREKIGMHLYMERHMQYQCDEKPDKPSLERVLHRHNVRPLQASSDTYGIPAVQKTTS